MSLQRLPSLPEVWSTRSRRSYRHRRPCEVEASNGLSREPSVDLQENSRYSRIEDLSQGISATLEWIKGTEGYNPLKYLDEVANKVDLLGHFLIVVILILHQQ